MTPFGKVWALPQGNARGTHRLCTLLLLLLFSATSGFSCSSSSNNNNSREVKLTKGGSINPQQHNIIHDDFSSKRGSIIDRRDVIKSTTAAIAPAFVALATAAASTPPSPAVAAYIDPNTALPKVTKQVYLDVQIGEGNKGEKDRLVIGLFGELLPRTCQNFETLCQQNAYTGTTFYRVLSDFSIQGGAIGDLSGKTGKSSTNDGNPFEPDNYDVMHSKAGLVSMVRDQFGNVDSRFFINCKDDANWADDRYAAFGIVQEGMEFVKKIEKVPVSLPQNSPKVSVNIIASGVL